MLPKHDYTIQQINKSTLKTLHPLVLRSFSEGGKPITIHQNIWRAFEKRAKI